MTAFLFWLSLVGGVAIGTCIGDLLARRLDRWLIARALRRARP